MIEYQRQEQIELIQSQGFLVKVIGVGGAGSNVLDQLALDGMDDAELICMNTDVRTLKTSTAHAKVQIGKQLTRGLGAGGDPELGILASEEAEEEIRAAVRGQNMVFVCTGIGGGTGSGAAPTVSRIAKEEGAFVVVFATMPFSFEGRRRIQQAETALKLLERSADALITFENDRMGELVLPKEGIQEAFANADKIISQSIKAITNVATQPGLIQIGMDDLLTALKAPVSRCLFGYGEAKGKNRAQEALKTALRSPLLDRGKLLGKSRNALVHVVGGPSMTLYEVELLMNEMSKNVGSETQILFGAATDEKMEDRLSVTIISALSLDDLRRHESVHAQTETIEVTHDDPPALETTEAEAEAQQAAETEAQAQEEEAEARRREEEARQAAEEEAARIAEEQAQLQAREEAEAKAREEAAAEEARLAEEQAQREAAEAEAQAQAEAEAQAKAREEAAAEQARQQAAAEAEAEAQRAQREEKRKVKPRRAKAQAASSNGHADESEGDKARHEAFQRRREELKRNSSLAAAATAETPAEAEVEAEPEAAVEPPKAAPAPPRHTAEDLMAQRRQAQEELKRKREELERLLKLEDEAKRKRTAPPARSREAAPVVEDSAEPAPASSGEEGEDSAPADLEQTQRIPVASRQEPIPRGKAGLVKPKKAPKRSRSSVATQSDSAPAAVREAAPPVSPSSQTELQLEPLRGRFEKATPTMVDGENLDVPTFFRKRGKKG